MESKEPSVFVSTYKEGVERVLGGNYAFLCESSMLDWLVQRDCNLTQIGGLVDNKGYGIATPKGSKWRDEISQAILYLQEKSSIQVSVKCFVVTDVTYLDSDLRCCITNGGARIRTLSSVPRESLISQKPPL